MKIYCSRFIEDINNFIGKDIWVEMYSTDYDEFYYCKLLETYTVEWNNELVEMIEFKTIPSKVVKLINKEHVTFQDQISLEYIKLYHYIDDDTKGTSSCALKYFTKIYSFARPIEILTGEELHGILNELCEKYL